MRERFVHDYSPDFEVPADPSRFRPEPSFTVQEMPILRQIVNLWSLRDYPQTDAPWRIDIQLDAIKSAGFELTA